MIPNPLKRVQIKYEKRVEFYICTLSEGFFQMKRVGVYTFKNRVEFLNNYFPTARVEHINILPLPHGVIHSIYDPARLALRVGSGGSKSNATASSELVDPISLRLATATCLRLSNSCKYSSQRSRSSTESNRR